MAVRKPSTFPLRNTIDGSEELYTQTNGVSQKFTVEDVRLLVLSGVDNWILKEVVVTDAGLQTIATIPIQLLDETLLAVDEYYEVNRIVCEYNFNTIAPDLISPLFVLYKPDPSTLFNSTRAIYSFTDTVLESSLDVITLSYMANLYNPYRKNHGVYLHAAKTTPSSGGGDSTFKLKIYYKISQWG
jgi:hypothetical protein